jgi:hypothetical protein
MPKTHFEGEGVRPLHRSMTWTRSKGLMIMFMLEETCTRHGKLRKVLDLDHSLRKRRYNPWDEATGM